MKKSIICAGLLVGAASLVALPLHAAPPPGKGKPSSEATQNLSVPAILVGSLGTLACGETDLFPSALVPPTGTPLTGYEVPGYYWVQKVHKWQTQCFNATSATARAAWGDNLSGDAKLKVGSPIRVEIVLTNMTDFSGTLQGYSVTKLQPSLADRLSAYGHQATGDAVSGWGSNAVDFQQADWVVHDAGMQISVENLDNGDFVVPLQPIAPEINATGKIVYGYNLRVSATGNYQIRFNTTPSVTFTGVDAGTFDANNAYIDIVVSPGGGKGGGGGKNR